MIYLISDPHGGENRIGLERYLSVAKDDDLLIILGDLGLKFEITRENEQFTSWFLNLDSKIAIVDGNHENHAFLNSFPEERWCGGVVNRLSKNIVRLKRGNVFCIDGKTFFVFGGCKSSSRWKEAGLWYPGEEASEDELQLAYENIEKYNFKFDYILTHKYEQDPPIGTVSVKLLELTKYIEEKVAYGRWYSGHWHQNKRVDDKHTVVYDELLPLTDHG